MENRRAKAAREWEENPFGGSAVIGGSAVKETNKQLWMRGHTVSAGTTLLKNQTMDSLEGYLKIYIWGSNTTCRKRRVTRRVSSQSCNISWRCCATETRDKASVRTGKQYEKERDTVLQYQENGSRRTCGDCMYTLRGGWTYRATQKECMLLWPDKDDRPKGVGSITDGRKGSGVQRRWMAVGDSTNSST